jgi:alkylhydroperoxidase/carboxymuconolactone decarboxylase family protein
MSDSYFNPEDLKKFKNITEFQEELGTKFFDYYGAVFKEGALTEREKALIALAVAHAVQCPYCIDAYSSGCLQKGADEEQMMEAVHVAAAIKSGAALVNSVQMMNHVKKKTM